MLQRWKRENSAGDQSYPASVFPFVFQEMSDDDFYIKKIMFFQIPPVRQQRSVSKTIYLKTKTIQWWLPEIWPPEHHLLLQILHFSLQLNFLYCLSLLFLDWWPLCCFKDIFSINYNFIPHLCLYIFYFIFHINYPVCLLKLLVLTKL